MEMRLEKDGPTKTFNVNLLVLEMCLHFYRKWLGGYFKNPRKDDKGQKHSSGNKDDTFKS